MGKCLSLVERSRGRCEILYFYNIFICIIYFIDVILFIIIIVGCYL